MIEDFDSFTIVQRRAMVRLMGKDYYFLSYLYVKIAEYRFSKIAHIKY